MKEELKKIISSANPKIKRAYIRTNPHSHSLTSNNLILKTCRTVRLEGIEEVVSGFQKEEEEKREKKIRNQNSLLRLQVLFFFFLLHSNINGKEQAKSKTRGENPTITKSYLDSETARSSAYSLDVKLLYNSESVSNKV
jgi:hypothetical protein